MNKNSVGWKGVFCPIITPFNKDGSLDEKALRENIRLLINDGVDGIIPVGCTGEPWALSKEEKQRVFQLSMNETAGKITVIGGTSAIGTREVIELTQYAQELGMDGVMIHPPSFIMPSRKEVISQYRAISDAADIPIMLYNLPHRVNSNLSPEIVDEAANLKTVVSIKESSKNMPQIIETLRLTHDRLSLFVGHENLVLPCVVVGAAGVVAPAVQIVGKMIVDLCSFSQKGDIKTAQNLQYKVSLLYKKLFGMEEAYPSSIKEMMNLLGRPGGYPRLPILPMQPAEKEELKNLLKELGLL